MSVSEEEVSRIRSLTDIASLISEHTTLKRSGRRLAGKCPFHAEKTPSFSVNVEEGLYYCFGCQASGDAITFVRNIEGLDFVEALEYLASKAGTSLVQTSTESNRSSKERTQLLKTLEDAASYYHETLLNEKEAGKAREYLRSRGYDGDLVRKFRLGFAKDRWNDLVTQLKLTNGLAQASGLGFINKRGSLQDSFRGRIMFPICDSSGHVIAFGGRILPTNKESSNSAQLNEPKYKNSKETTLYSKRRTLYNLHQAKRQIVQSEFAVICEGYTDVIAFDASGVFNSVATCGTAFGEEHLTILSSFTRKLVLAFDADGAGQNAAEKVYEWEKKFELDISVAQLPNGKDPGDLLKSQPTLLKEAVSKSKPYLSFRLDKLFSRANVSTAEGRAKAAALAVSIVNEHPDELVKDQYFVEIAGRCHLEPEQLRKIASTSSSPNPNTDDSQPNRSRPNKSRQSNGQTTKENQLYNAEREVLRQCIQNPAEIADYVDIVLFTTPIYKHVFDCLMSSSNLNEAIELAGEYGANLIHRLSVEETDALPLDAASRLIEGAARRALMRLEQDAKFKSQQDAIILLDEAIALRRAVEDLRNPVSSGKAAKELLAFLVQESLEFGK